MTNKSTYLMLLAIAAVATSGTIFATSSMSADADDVNKGIGETEVWEPGPETTQGNDELKDRPFDANKRAVYRGMEKSLVQSNISDSVLLENLEKIRSSDIPLVASAIDYEKGAIVIYTPEPNLDSKIKRIIGDIQYIVIEREWDALRNPWNNGPIHPDEMEPKLDTQSNDGSIFDLLSSWNILQFANADASTDNWYGTHIDDDVSTYDGAYAKIEVHDSGITLPNGVTLFGGTLMPNSESGLEIAIRYTSGVYEFTVYDHYDGSFTVEEDMDSTWMNT